MIRQFSALVFVLGVWSFVACSGTAVSDESGDGDGSGDGDSAGDGDGTGDGDIGGDGDGSSPPTWEEIYERIDAFNHCADVADCQGIGAKPCETRYVNADEDTTDLEKDIQDRLDVDYPDPLGCDASCQCGLLSCSPEGKCVTESGTCEEPVDDSKVFVCL